MRDGEAAVTTAHAPVAIFCYRRPEHLRLTLQSLSRCAGFDESPVFVFGDGPRNESERAAVEAVRDVARSMLGARATYHFSDANRGLSASIVAGVGAVLKDHDRVIVVEDDLELSASFLRYMNAALDRYAGETRVFQVSGYMFGVNDSARQDSALFLPLTTSWGWATWRRAWRVFDPKAVGWEALRTDRRLRSRFNLGGAYDYARMLEQQMNGKRDSWAIRWYWSVFKENGLVLFPPLSLVRNNGFDGSGTHGRGLLSRFKSGASRSDAPEPVLPERAVLDPEALDRVAAALGWENGGWKARMANAIRGVLGR